MYFIVGIRRGYNEVDFTFENSDEAMSFAKNAKNNGEDGISVRVKLVHEEGEGTNDNDD